jgi:hypothetical protein
MGCAVLHSVVDELTSAAHSTQTGHRLHAKPLMLSTSGQSGWLIERLEQPDRDAHESMLISVSNPTPT